MPFAGHGAHALIEALQQHRREVNGPAMDRGMIDADAALGHHFLEVSQAQIVGQIPTNAQQDDRLVEMAALEHRNSRNEKGEARYHSLHCQKVCNRTLSGDSPLMR